MFNKRKEIFLDWIENSLEKRRKKRRVDRIHQMVTFGKGTYIDVDSALRNLSYNNSNIVIGEFSSIHGELMVFKNSGNIRIGNYCFVGPGSRIWSRENITIGDYVLISHNVNIHDTNSHPINVDERRHEIETIYANKDHLEKYTISNKPVVINDNVWIGFNSTILKGVFIGENSIIAANTLVTKNVPENVLFGGNPGKILKQL